MRQLIQELMEPRIYADGVIKQPNAAMMAAGKEIMRLNQLWEQDRAGRSRAESMVNILTDEIAKSTLRFTDQINKATAELNKFTEAMKEPTLDDAVIAYKNAMNKDYDYNTRAD